MHPFLDQDLLAVRVVEVDPQRDGEVAGPGIERLVVRDGDEIADAIEREGLADEAGFAFVADGLIVDDLTDVRPGRRAAAEAGVRSPLAEAGFTKTDVRARSQALGLPTWDRPASPCLSSRIPYGTLVTVGALRRLETAEAALRALGFRELRVRHFGERARVEIAPDELPRLEDGALRAACESAVRAAGYAAVEIDPAGYRRGRLNEPGTH